MNLHTSIAAQQWLVEATQKANKTTKFVKVDRAALAGLLMDHANMVHQFNREGIHLEYPADD
jgi:hypothetical protein